MFFGGKNKTSMSEFKLKFLLQAEWFQNLYENFPF